MKKLDIEDQAAKDAAEIAGTWAGKFIDAGRLDFSDAVHLRDAVAAALRKRDERSVELEAEIEQLGLRLRQEEERSYFLRCQEQAKEIERLRAEKAYALEAWFQGNTRFQDYIKIHGTRLDGLKAALEAVGRGFWLGMYRGAPMYCDCQHNIRAEIAAEEGRGND